MKKRMGLTGNPLDNVEGKVSILQVHCRDFTHYVIQQTDKAQYMFQYFLKVVSTQFRTLNNAQTVSVSYNEFMNF